MSEQKEHTQTITDEEFISSFLHGLEVSCNLLRDQTNRLRACMNDEKQKIEVLTEYLETTEEIEMACTTVIDRFEHKYPDELCLDNPTDDDESEPEIDKMKKEREKEKKEKKKEKERLSSSSSALQKTYVLKPKCQKVLTTGKNRGSTCTSNAVKDGMMCSKHCK